MSISVHHFSFQFQNHADILNQINFKISDGQMILLTGPSGSGKSTLLKWISGLFPKFIEQKYHKKGQINVNGKNIDQINSKNLTKNVVMMFQNPNHQFTMTTVKGEMVFALENQQTNPKKIMSKIENVLKQFHLESFINRKIKTLSGGEKQQIALAIIIAMQSKVILLDEPFANVDGKSRNKILSILMKIKRSGRTILIVDHDLSNYSRIIDNYLYLNRDGILSEVKHINDLPNYKWFNQKQPTFQLPLKSLSPIFQLNHFKISRNHQDLLKNENFKIFMNKITLITGDNGIGKSTLLATLIKMMKYHGEIKLGHRNISKIRRKKYFKQVGMTFQNAEKQFIMINVKEELNLSFKNTINPVYSKKTIHKWLAKLNLINHLHQVVYTLSEGQKKKLQIIVMLIMNPKVLLMDEPFQGIDYYSLNIILKMLKNAKIKHQQTIIIISHQIIGIDQIIDYHIRFANHKLQYSRRIP